MSLDRSVFVSTVVKVLMRWCACFIFIHTPFSHLVFGGSLQRQASLSLRQHYPANAKLSSWCFLQWHYCLSHGPGDGGENGGHSPLWCHETRAHMHRGWMQQIFTRAKLDVLLTDAIWFFLWFFCKNQLPWKGPCDFNLHPVRLDRYSSALGDSLT